MKLNIASYPALALTVISGSIIQAFTVNKSIIHQKRVQRYSLFLSARNTNNGNSNDGDISDDVSRKSFLNSFVAASSSVILGVHSQPALADSRPESLDIDNFLRTGTEAFPMGVSSQAGKSKPVTGVYLRDGTEPLRSKTGDVLSEIVLGPDKSNLSAVLVSFTSIWPLAKGTVFDVECRDSKTGDGAFLSVTTRTETNDITKISESFFLDQLFAPTGRFSFYGSPTNIKLKKSEIVDNGKKRVIEFSFSNLSQSTNAEIPRTAMMVATIPGDLNQAVMLVGSATTSRWSKGAEKSVRNTIDSFNASLSPRTSMSVRAKQPDYTL